MEGPHHPSRQAGPGSRVIEDLGLSRLGFGAAPLGNEYGDVDESEMARTVNAAIDCGVTFFDTSPYYGRTVSETRLGAALAGRRDEVVLCTKAGRYDLSLPDGFDFSPERLRRSVDESLGRLRTDRLDILLLHDIEFSEPSAILEGAIPVLHELRQQGKTRAVGVSSYRSDVLLEVLTSSRIDVVLTYCHTDLIDASAVEGLVPAAACRGVSVLAASPLHMGLLTPGGGPEWHPALAGARARAGALRAAAAELGLSLTDAALSFSLELPDIASTVVGVASTSELHHNVAAWYQPVNRADIDRLLDRVAAFEIEPWPCGIWPTGPPPRAEESARDGGRRRRCGAAVPRRPTTGGGAVSTTTIASVSVHDIRFPTSDSLGGSDAMNPAPDYSAPYVELRTSRDDLAGFGFTFTIGRGSEIVTRMVADLAGGLVGRPIDDMPAFMAEVLEEVTQDSALRWLGPEKGVAHLAAGAVLNAAWDLWARMRGVPLWKLLVELEPEELVGCLAMRHLGDVLTQDEAVAMLVERRAGRDHRIEHLRQAGYPAYVTSAGWLGYSDEQICGLVTEALEQGWDAFKLKVGQNLRDDQRRVTMVRDLIGDGRKLMVDANQVWEVPEAIEWINAISDANLYWVEEPTSPDDIRGHRAIAEAIAPILVASGEHAHNRIMFKQMLATGAIGVCQIDSCRLASVNENVPVLLMAEKYQVPVCPHAGGVGLCELVQHLSMFDYIAVSASLEGRWIEYIDHLHEMFVTPVQIRNGAYELPAAPGFSSEMSQDAIAAYSYPDGAVWKARS